MLEIVSKSIICAIFFLIHCAPASKLMVSSDSLGTIANWITALATAVYALVVCYTVYFVRKQLKENKLLREATVIKDVYDYIKKTSYDRSVIYKNEDKILRVRSDRDLKKFKKKSPKIYTAIHEVANCYHYIGFLIKSDLLTNKRAIYQEGGDTILGIHRIIKGVIARDREFAQKNTYKQYLDFIVEDIEKFKQMDALAGKR